MSNNGTEGPNCRHNSALPHRSEFKITGKNFCTTFNFWMSLARSSVADPHLLFCGSGSRIPKMFIWIRIRILGVKRLKKKNNTKKISTKSLKLTLPHLSMRIRIREGFLYADPCESGSATLARSQLQCFGSGLVF